MIGKLKNFKHFGIYYFGMILIAGFVLVFSQSGQVKEQTKQVQAESNNNIVKEAPVVLKEAKIVDKKQNTTVITAQSTAKKAETVVTEVKPKAIVTEAKEVKSLDVKADSVPKNEVQRKTTTLVISNVATYTVEVKEGENAFDQLLRASEENGFEVKYEMTSFGPMITKIGNTEAKGTFYWALYYNGDYSMFGARDLKIFNNDVIEWRFESWA